MRPVQRRSRRLSQSRNMRRSSSRRKMSRRGRSNRRMRSPRRRRSRSRQVGGAKKGKTSPEMLANQAAFAELRRSAGPAYTVVDPLAPVAVQQQQRADQRMYKSRRRQELKDLPTRHTNYVIAESADRITEKIMALEAMVEKSSLMIAAKLDSLDELSRSRDPHRSSTSDVSAAEAGDVLAGLD